jgi:alpha-tubulin suppressor-like RCC1 family protein
MLLRHRGHGGGGPPPPPGEEGALGENGIVTWGRAKSGVLGGGYHNIASYPYPQGVVGMSNILSIGSGNQLVALAQDYTVHTVGGKTGSGTGSTLGEGKPEGGAGQEVDTPLINWFPVTGEYPQYPEEVKKITKTSPNWTQPVGAPSVRIFSKAEYEDKVHHPDALYYVIAVAAGEGHCLCLTNDHRVIAWGANNGGELGVGWEFHGGKPVEEEEEGKWPTWGPGWVQVSGLGPATPDPRHAGVSEAQMLKDVIAMVPAQEISWFLKSNGEVWYTGSPVSNGEQTVFATKDPLWTPDPTNKPIAIVGTKQGYALLLADHTVKWVGHVIRFCAGDGLEESATLHGREVRTPLLADKSVPKNVTAIAMGSSSLKFLKEGVVYTAGDNRTLQQGLAGVTAEQNVQYMTPMPLLNAGGRTVVAISGTGEVVYLGEVRGQGANGGDSYMYLMDDGSCRVTGLGWAYNTGLPERFEAYGLPGVGTSENHIAPTEPVGKPKNIVQVVASNSHMLFVQEPGQAAVPTIEVAVSGSEVTVTWRDPPGTSAATLGQFPLWRAADGWTVTLIGLAGGKTFKSGTLPSGPIGTHTFTFTGIPTGEIWECVVAETGPPFPEYAILGGATNSLSVALVAGTAPAQLELANPLVETLLRATQVTIVSGANSQTYTTAAEVPAGTRFIPVNALSANFAYPVGAVVHTDGSVKTASAGVLSPSWADPPSPEPVFFLEYQRRGGHISHEPEPYSLAAAIPEGIVLSIVTTGKHAGYKAGEYIRVTSGAHSQTFQVSAKVEQNATTIPVTAVFSTGFPNGSEINRVTTFQLTAPLSTTGITTELHVDAVPEPFASTENVKLDDGAGHVQVFELQTVAATGATTITISPTVAKFAFPATTTTGVSVAREDRKRVEPDAAGSARSMTFTMGPPGHSDITGEDARVWAIGEYGGAYGKRIREFHT